MFIDGLIRVGDCGAEEIAKHGSGLIKRDPMFTEILDRFGRIPFKLHTSSLAGSARPGHWNARRLAGGPLV